MKKKSLFLEMHYHEKAHEASILLIGSDNNNTMSSQPYRRTAADNFLYSEKEKSDYEWLVTPPVSPRSGLMNQLDAPGALKSELGNYFVEELSANQTTSSLSNSGIKRPSSSHSSRSMTRPSTPTTRPSSSGTSRATLITSSTTKRPSSSSRTTRATLTSSSTNSSRSTSRASTPTRRPSSSSGASSSRVPLTAARATTASTAKQTTGLLTSTRTNNRPMTAPNTESGTPTRRPSTPTGSSSTLLKSKLTKPAQLTTGSATSNNRPMTVPNSRSGTPTRRPSTPTGSSSTVLKSKLTKPAQQTTGSSTSNNRPMTAPNSRSGTPTRRPPTPTGSSTVLKSKLTKPVPSPIVRSRPWEPYEMPGFSVEAPSNLRTTLPDRPQTASASIERVVPRRQSCSPSRNRAPIGNLNGAGPTTRGRQGKVSSNDSGLNSYVIKENMRKLAPQRVTEKGARAGAGSSTADKPRSGSKGLGFGRNLSQSSIDMALRHLDIKRGSMRGNFRPTVTKVPATSLYSVRPQTNRPVSSSGSSESSVNILCLDGSSDDNLSERSYS